MVKLKRRSREGHRKKNNGAIDRIAKFRATIQVSDHTINDEGRKK